MATVGTDTAGGRFFARVHWSAVIAGALLALGVHIVMGLIGAALGFAAEPADSPGPVRPTPPGAAAFPPLSRW